MEELFEDGLYRVGGTREQFGAGWSYLLRREQGNLLLLNLAGSSVAALGPDFPAIEAMGGVSALFLNDRHNARRPEDNRISERFGAPLYCSVPEAKVVRKNGVHVPAPFPLERASFASDFEIVPTPGHTPGGVSYLWNSGRRRYLFIGDGLWNERGRWRYAVVQRNVPTMCASLASLKDLAFDVLVSNSLANDVFPCFEVDAAARARLLDGVIADLRATSAS
jgi:glyoxylase-like metal-dependent hydrolase (beta-lactamase superfamily II)